MGNKRTKDEINQDYSELCQKLGNITARYEASKALILQRVVQLSSEMTELEMSEKSPPVEQETKEA